jgi:hypothetical protein
MVGYCCEHGQESVTAKPFEGFFDDKIELMSPTPTSGRLG